METTQKDVTVSLDLISVSETNRIFRKEKEFSDAALKELAESIAEMGVIQPIGVRNDPEQPGRFIIIFGERRYRASKLAGKNDIPVRILNVDASEAFDMQMTENIHREDIHPLNEAKGYQLLLANHALLTTADLALRFGKSETYILQRLKLNDLVPEAKRDFYNNKMTIGHAIILARLIPRDQHEAIARLRDADKGYGTIAELQNFINRNIINDLSTAPFSMDDAELIKKAGPCSLCPKRTGCSPLLFADVKEKDRCIDRGCFVNKCNTFLINRTREIIETKPEVVLLTDFYETIPEVTGLLEEHQIKPLKEYNDFSISDKSGKKVNGLWLSGSRAGFMQNIYLKPKAVEASTENDPKAVIEKIQYRIKRGRELDQEKVYAKILEALKNHPTQKKECKKIQVEEEIFLWFFVYDKSSHHIKHALNKIIGITKDEPAKVYLALKSLKAEKKALILRKVMLDQYGGVYPKSDFAYIIRKIAESYGDIDIASFEKEQTEVRDKRESRAKERIKLIQQDK